MILDSDRVVGERIIKSGSSGVSVVNSSRTALAVVLIPSGVPALEPPPTILLVTTAQTLSCGRRRSIDTRRLGRTPCSIQELTTLDWESEREVGRAFVARGLSLAFEKKGYQNGCWRWIMGDG